MYVETGHTSLAQEKVTLNAIYLTQLQWGMHRTKAIHVHYMYEYHKPSNQPMVHVIC